MSEVKRYRKLDLDSDAEPTPPVDLAAVPWVEMILASDYDALASKLAAAERERNTLLCDKRGLEGRLEITERERDEANEAILIAEQALTKDMTQSGFPADLYLLEVNWFDLPAVRRALAAEQRREGEGG